MMNFFHCYFPLYSVLWELFPFYKLFRIYVLGKFFHCYPSLSNQTEIFLSLIIPLCKVFLLTNWTVLMHEWLVFSTVILFLFVQSLWESFLFYKRSSYMQDYPPPLLISILQCLTKLFLLIARGARRGPFYTDCRGCWRQLQGYWLGSLPRQK